MTTELRVRNQSQRLFLSAMTSAWRNSVQLHDPSIWLARDPEAEEKMLRDIDIAHAVGYRRGLAAGREWSLTPRLEGSARAPVAVSVGTELLDGIQHFTRARKNLARAFFSGSRFARIHGVTRKLTLGDGKPRTWWVPTRLEDLDKRIFRIVPTLVDYQTGKLSAHWERWNVGKGQFESESVRDAVNTIRHVYEDDQASMGHGRALREALGWWWYAKTHIFQESLQAVERFAQGILTASVAGARDASTGLPNTELISKWKDALEDMRSRHVLVYDESDNVEVIQPSGEGWQLLETMRGELKTAIFTLILGANLTTSADKGGSFALAEIQENSTEQIAQTDRELMQETLTDDLLGACWFHNRPNLVELGISEEKPRFSITQQKIQDPQARANVASTLNQMGVELAREDVLEQTGFRIPTQGEDVIQGGIATPTDFGTFGESLGIPQTDATIEPIAEPDIQDTALNGAQVQAAAEIIDRVVHGTMPPGTAKLMLVSMFNLPESEASAMVDEASAFQPAAEPTAAV